MGFLMDLRSDFGCQVFNFPAEAGDMSAITGDFDGPD